MKKRFIGAFLGVAAVAAVIPACGGAVGEAIRPKDHNASGALSTGGGKTCPGGAKYAKPLIVDLDPDARVDLEAAMKKGVVVVNYDCANLRVLTACKLPESAYEYAGVSRKEQVVQIKNADDLGANLPLSQAKLSAELTSGRTIDLALVLVGRRSTTVSKISKGQLNGDCDEATHYVQNATLGAFSMQTGSVGKVAAVAEMFGRGGSASSASERKAMNSDGSLDDCRTSKPDSETPPTECSAPLRVELVPLVSAEAPASAEKKGEAKDDKKAAQAQENPCPPGYAFTDGICTRAANAAFVCDPKNEVQCREQCDKGSFESCFNYGTLLTKKQPRNAALPYFRKACDGELAEGCASLGVELMPDGDEPDVQARARESLQILTKACTMGAGRGCDFAGDVLTDKDYKIVDVDAAVRIYDRGCSLGEANACWSLSQIYIKGKGVPKNAKMGVSLLNKACLGGSSDECQELADLLWKGIDDVPADRDAAFRATRRACDIDPFGYCINATKIASSMGKASEAFAFAQRGCNVADEEACAKLAEFYESGTGTSADPTKATEARKKACKDGDGDEKSCKMLGIPIKD
jgi:uncharacterized protein